MGGVEVVYRLDEADAAHLEEVVHVFPAAGELLDDGEHQPQVAADELLARGLVAGAGAPQQSLRFLVLQNGQLRGVYAAYLYFSLQRQSPFHGRWRYFLPEMGF